MSFSSSPCSSLKGSRGTVVAFLGGRAKVELQETTKSPWFLRDDVHDLSSSSSSSSSSVHGMSGGMIDLTEDGSDSSGEARATCDVIFSVASHIHT